MRTVREEIAAETLAKIGVGELARCVLPWVPLMRYASNIDTIREWKRLAESEPDVHLRSDFGGIALVFAELAKRGEFWRQHLEDWNVQQSQQVLEWQREARQEGIKEGFKEGRKEAIRRVLQRRFPDAATAKTLARVNALNDADEIDRLFDAALEAASFDAFQQQIDKKP
ncbi:MAG: hypothetical protein KY475_03330 [Planctomycetes bacterium]|nr:hypothetical protein [Planctomycetota bacterium]